MISSRLVGTIIENKYRLDEQIGHGGMGAVYRGTQLMVDRTVAVKLLQTEFASHDNFKARFEVEAKAIGRMNHPNCITLFDFGYSQNIEAFYTVVEYINGRSLGSLLAEKLSLNTAVSVIRQIASGLDHAHHHGIIHRDLKPENIMLARMTDGSEMVKVLDFGIAQIIKGTADNPHNDGSDLYAPLEDDFESDRITRVGEVFGTPPYMSPEQARSTRNLTPACDLYSLGVIFYELIAGQLPFFSDNPLDILLMHINNPPPPITRLENLPELNTVIMRLLEKDPTLRIQSGQELIALLDAISPEALERESSKKPSATPLPARPILPQPLDTPGRSWVEACEYDEVVAAFPNFAPPAQALNRGRPISPPDTAPEPPANLASLSQNGLVQDRAVGFETIISFDEIESAAASQRATRWGLLVLVTALAGLFIFLLFHYEDQLRGRTPITNAASEPALQLIADDPNIQPNAENPNAENNAEPAFDNVDNANNERKAEILPATAPPEITRKPSESQSAPPSEPQFPAATRPSTIKKESSKRRKKSSATSTSKTDKIERDDSSNPPSKGRRILEF